MLKSLTHLTIIGLLLIFLFNIGRQPAVADINFLNFGSVQVKVDLAITEYERMMGLSGRKNLPANEGLLFVFEEPGIYHFWMKDMNFPIDIIWLDRDLKIVHIQSNARPEDYPKLYEPAAPAVFVLEVVSGFAEKNNLQLGDIAVPGY